MFIYSDLSSLLENNIRQSPNSNENEIRVLKDNGFYIVRSLINETIDKLKNILINDIKGTDTNPGINYNNYYNKEEDILCFLDSECKINVNKKLNTYINETKIEKY